MVFDDLLKNVPNHRVLLFHQFLSLFDGCAVPALLEPVVDERLEQLERHLLRQTALMQFQLRPDHDHRTARIIHALAEQILPEAPLLALQRVGKRLQRPVVGASQNAAAPPVVKQRVNGFLQHALFVPNNHVRRVQLHQLLQTVVAVDHLRYRSFKSEVANRPPSSGTSGRSSGGITGITSRIIHSGLLPDLRKLSTTLSRLAYFSFFCAEVSVFIFSRISWLRLSMSIRFSSSLTPSAPIMAVYLPANSWSSWRFLSSLITSACERPVPSPASMIT